ncbi:MAG: hypothetical protein ACKOXH_03030 [Aquirufa sp.]
MFRLDRKITDLEKRIK